MKVDRNREKGRRWRFVLGLLVDSSVRLRRGDVRR